MSNSEFKYYSIHLHSTEIPEYECHKNLILISIWEIKDGVDKLSTRFQDNEIAKIKKNHDAYPFGFSHNFRDNIHNIIPEVDLIPNKRTAIDYQYLTNTREHPMTVQQFCERCIDRSVGEDYICRDMILRAK